MGKKEVSEMEAPEYHDDHTQNGGATIGHWHSGPSGGAFEPGQITDLIQDEEDARIATDTALGDAIILNSDKIGQEISDRTNADAAEANARAAADEALDAAIRQNAADIAALGRLIEANAASNLTAHAGKADSDHDHIGYLMNKEI
jgi:hypothetical protein